MLFKKRIVSFMDITLGKRKTIRPMIIFGSRASNIGSFNIPNSKCDYCEQGDTQHVSVFGKYAHVFWIPLFPIGKKAVSECTHCKRTIDQSEFSPELRKLYQENKSQAKRPIWHWIGLAAFLGLVGLVIAIGSSAESDPRGELFNADKNLMTTTPTMESDSISYKMKMMFDNLDGDGIDADKFKYYVKQESDKALVLIQIPELRKADKEVRSQLLEIAEMVTDAQDDLKGKDLYLGMIGFATPIVIKTPTYEANSRLALSSELYNFYGEEPAATE